MEIQKNKRSEIDFKKYSDKELVYMVERATELPEKEVNGQKLKGTKLFQYEFNTPFDYQQATYELKTRGYDQKWIKTSNIETPEVFTEADYQGIVRVPTYLYEDTVKKLNEYLDGRPRELRRVLTAKFFKH